MGLLSSTLLSQVFLPCVISRARTTCTTIPLPSLAGPGQVLCFSLSFDLILPSGAFDTPKPKCPPDRGSSDCVTGSPAPIFSASNNPSYFYSPSNPRPIPAARGSSASDLATPPLTPDNGSPVFPAVSDNHQKDALDFLMTIFPRHGLAALPHSKSVAISAPNMGAAFDGVVLQLPGKPKTLYVDGKSAQSVSIRDRCVRILSI